MGKGKGFDGLDLEDMFAEAVEASESTAGDNPELYSKNAKIKDPVIEVVKEPVVTKQPETAKEIIQPVVEAKKEVVEKIERPVEIIKEVEKPIVIEKVEPLIKPQENVDLSNINVNVINRIIEMKEILDNYSDREKSFIKGYFQNEDDHISQVIYSALTANRRGLDALNKITTARGHKSAERAFYLMELDNNSVEAIYEQINLLTGELDNLDRVNDSNKIKICRSLEKVIADMDESVFLYINKLQEFTSKALI